MARRPEWLTYCPPQPGPIVRYPNKRGKYDSLKHILIGAGALILFTLSGIVYLLFFWPRPVDTTEARVWRGDGSQVDYCDIQTLDGEGLNASEIPKAYTPGCKFDVMPMPILANCREPLSEGLADMRGLWRGITGRIGHLERIEQCGNRFVITVEGLIHDFRADGTLANGARDVNPAGCSNLASAIRSDRNGALHFRPFNLFDAVERRLEDNHLAFTYIDGIETRMERICRYPSSHEKGQNRK